MQQILWFEVVMKSMLGLALLLLPLTVARIAGFERPPTAFWPRLVGCGGLGVAAAVFIGLHFPDARGGLGPAGLVAINLGAAAGLLVPLIMGHAAPTRRGRLLILATMLALVALGFVEIAHI